MSAANVLQDALWLADLPTMQSWDTYECGHGATVALTCPYRCKAWRRMRRVFDHLAGVTDA